MRFRSIYQLLFTFIFAQLALADDYILEPAKENKTPVSILRLADAIDEAVQNNPLLQASIQEARSRKANIEPQAALDDPTIGLELDDYTTSNLHKSTDAGNKLTVRQKIPFPGKRQALREAAAHEYQAGVSDADLQRLELIRELKKGYYEFAFTYLQKDLLNQQLKLIRSTLAFARSNYTLGKVLQSDVFALQVEEISLRTKLVENRQTLATLRAELNHMLGRSTNEEWKPEETTISKIDSSGISEVNLISLALTNNPRLKLLISQLDASKSRESYANLNLYPDFEIMAGYISRRSSEFDEGDDAISAGVGITIPLWRASKQDKLIEKAEADKRKTQNLLQQEKNQVTHAIHSTIAALRESEAQISLARDALLPLTDAAIRSSQKAYEVGETQLLVVLNLMKSRFEAQINYFKSIASHEGSIADLDALLGDSFLKVGLSP